MILRVLFRLVLSVMTVLVLANLVRGLSVPADTIVQTPFGPLEKCGG